ncbi:MAG: hypothetical protein CMF62_02890 [Magnetococcales bacterium]|nr:hypothetical protein [Magnetococcales bacterium]|tara:strand:+ start:242 stop:451 length:210 start_codon:yes stop_codon:yes gene_type:complete
MDIESYVDTYFDELKVVFNPIIVNYMKLSSFESVYNSSKVDNKEKLAITMILNLYYCINSSLQIEKKID